MPGDSRKTSLPPDLRRSSITGPPDLRRTSSQMPVNRQVGFHVEGVAESPAHESTLADQHLQAGAVTAGSPSPVTIPPTFQAISIEAQNATEARAALDLRTTSLPLEAAAPFLPDSHLARGGVTDVEISITTVSTDLCRSEMASKQHGNPWEAAAALNTTGRDPTTRGGMRLGSYSGSTPLTPVKEPNQDCSSDSSPRPLLNSQAQQDSAPSGLQSPQHPHRQPDAIGSHTAEWRSTLLPTPPATPPGSRSPHTASHLPFALATPRLRAVTDPGQPTQESNLAQTSSETKSGRIPGDGRPPLGDYSMRFDRGRSTDDARHSADRSSRSSGEGRHSEDRPGAASLERHNSATLAAIAAAAEAGAAAKGRSPVVTPPGRSPHLTPTTSSAAADFSSLSGQQRLQASLPSGGASPRSSLQHSPQKQHSQSLLLPLRQQQQPRLSLQGNAAASGHPTSPFDSQSVVSKGTLHAQQLKQKRQQQQEPQQQHWPEGQQQQGEQQPQQQRKQMSKAERRAMQEAQRAAKAAAKGQSGNSKPKGKGPASADDSHPPSKTTSTAGGIREAAPSGNTQPRHAPDASEGAAGALGGPPSSSADRGLGGGKGRDVRGGRQEGRPLPHSAELFSHLQQYKRVSAESVMAEGESGAASVHPAVLRLGLRLGDGSLQGASARCAHMLSAFRCVVEDYVTPQGKVLSRDLMSVMNTCIHFLVGCRPLSVGMGNAIKYLKTCISKLELGMPESAAKGALCDLIDNYVQEKIVFAGEVLARQAIAKLRDDDVILTYSASSVVLAILLKAKQEALRFRVVVVDARPGMEGRRLLRQLLQAGVHASYLHINSINYIMPEVTKVVLGASSVNSNGTVMSHVGSAAVAMAAEARGVPVLVCCEAFKFVGRVQLDSITANELGDPAAVTAAPCQKRQSEMLKDWEDKPNLALLNLKYDAMPSEYVSVIVTEFGAIPPTSVPVILREHLLDVGT